MDGSERRNPPARVGGDVSLSSLLDETVEFDRASFSVDSFRRRRRKSSPRGPLAPSFASRDSDVGAEDGAGNRSPSSSPPKTGPDPDAQDDETIESDRASFRSDRKRRRSSRRGGPLASSSLTSRSSRPDGAAAPQEVGSMVYRARHEPLHRDPVVNGLLRSCIARKPRYNAPAPPPRSGSKGAASLGKLFKRMMHVSDGAEGRGAGARQQQRPPTGTLEESWRTASTVESEGSSRMVEFNPSMEVCVFDNYFADGNHLEI